MSRLQSIPAEVVPLVLAALEGRRGTTPTHDLLTAVLPHLANPDHRRWSCNCDTCGLYRRIERHLGKEPAL